ncbi:MAG: hypothetical protein IT165_21280 [Bryobacterales bacterium]|nr:hypothetical protein [Bryobacterales bacterium]
MWCAVHHDHARSPHQQGVDCEEEGLTGGPADKVDRRLEVLVESSEDTPALPIGLRVTVRFEGL